MNLALVFLVSKAQGDSLEALELDLLKRANGWLRRKQAGVHDSLLVVGDNFQSEEEFKDFLSPYGLVDADLAVIPASHDENRGELVEAVVEPWLYKKHPTAVSFIEWSKYCDSGIYPKDGWWWAGVEAHDQELSSMYERMVDYVPYDFKKQAFTWLALLLEEKVKWLFESDAEDFEVCMLAISLSRWLTGFDAAAGNNSYDFNYHDAVSKFSVNRLRLGFEAGRNLSSDLLDEIQNDGIADDELDAVFLRHCLVVRNDSGETPSSLKRAFGSETALLWGAYSSIWPNLKKPMNAAIDELMSAGWVMEIGDLMKINQFVCDGWGDEF